MRFVYWQGDRIERIMEQCPSILTVHLLHDGELSSDAQHLIQQHLTGCAECTAELNDLQSLTPAFGKLFPDVRLSMIEKARLDARWKAETNELGNTLDWVELAHTARMLSAIAASIVLISSIWLAEIPSRHTTAVSPAVVAVSARDLYSRNQALAGGAAMPAWERAALTLRVDPRLEDSRSGLSDVGVADARMFNDNSPDGPVADWIVAGLGNRSSGHAYP